MKKIYPTLYSRDNLNNVREWIVEQLDNKYRVKSGIKESNNQVVNEWTVVDDAKNSTDTTAQAQKECESLIKCWMLIPCRFFRQAEQVDDPDIAWTIGEILAIAVTFDVLFNAGDSAESELRCFFIGDNES